MHTTNEKLQAFQRLLTIMDELREQCPWDKKQTIQSLRHLTLEEVHELSEAILVADLAEVKKELGDILLHIVFYARIASETQAFDIADVIHQICDKLIKRHPHIYADAQVSTEQEVKQNWEKIKLQEGNTSVLAGVPASLPALIKAYRMQEKARGVGFDWDEPYQVWDKVQEEMQEFQEHINAQTGELLDHTKAEAELGDLLFALVNYARFLNLNPEDALEKTNQKFKRRFTYLEQQAQQKGLNLSQMTLEQMIFFWEEAKKNEKN